MRTRALFFGVLLLLGLARPAAAQFSTTMGATMTGGTGSSSSGNTSTQSSFFSQLLGSKAHVPSFNVLSLFPAAPKTYGTMLGRTPTGTTPQAIIIMPAQQSTGFFRNRQTGMGTGSGSGFFSNSH